MIFPYVFKIIYVCIYVPVYLYMIKYCQDYTFTSTTFTLVVVLGHVSITVFHRTFYVNAYIYKGINS